ncbi:MAG: VWA domain-containing protein [Pseudomonadota bacterium]|nr:VWA domain-containing protein [Pseudomonadota bacterium]
MAARGSARLHADHLRPALRPSAAAALHCIVLDCSASMLAGGQLARAKGLLAALLAQTYRWRERVAVISFSGQGVALRLPPRRAMRVADAWLAPIGGGGGTPLADALTQADALLRRQPGSPRWLWLLTDGRARHTPPRPLHAEHLRIIDFDTAPVPLGRAPQLAAQWQAGYLRADRL